MIWEMESGEGGNRFTEHFVCAYYLFNITATQGLIISIVHTGTLRLRVAGHHVQTALSPHFPGKRKANLQTLVSVMPKLCLSLTKKGTRRDLERGASINGNCT